ncbi:MAG: PD40 domain-containing protein [Anaerolineae bacterium]|nr:PD40 domain-containing protein [Anaerolineae bacterium]
MRRTRSTLLFAVVWLAVFPSTAQANDLVRLISWSPDGKLAAVDITPQTLGLFDVVSGQLLQRLEGHSGEITSIAWSPDSKRLATGSEDATVRIWNADTGQNKFVFEGLEPRFTTVAWSPNGTWIATSNLEVLPNLILYNAETGEIAASFEVASSSYMSWSPDGAKFVIIVVYAPFVQLLDSPEFSKETQLPVDTDGFVTAVTWSSDSQQLLIGTDKGFLQLWNVEAEKKIAEFQGTEGSKVPDNPFARAAINVNFSTDGKAVMSVNADGTIRLWEIATGELLGSIQLDLAETAYTPYPIADWSPYRGRLIYVSSTSDSEASAESDLAALGVKIATPFASAEQLRSIADSCVTQGALKNDVDQLIEQRKYADLMTAIKALSSDQIPPACAADLIAVAEALK